MLFEIKSSVKDKEIIFKSASALIKFIEEGENFENELREFESEFHLKINGIQKTNFLDEKNDGIKFYNFTGNPDIVFINKIKTKNLTVDYFRNSLTKIITQIENENLEFLHIIVPFAYKFNSIFPTEDHFYRSIVEGVHYGNYSFTTYKSKKEETKKLKIIFHTTNREAFEKSLHLGELLMDAVTFTRDLVNEPAITVTPDELAKRVKSKLGKTSVKISILDEKDLESKKMNSVLAVGKGSSNPPKLIIMEYSPKDAKKHVALVGKGVTYDSGGYSLKPTDGMVDMKADMAGGALVIGSILAAANAEIPIKITGIVPAVENLVNGNAFKPGDIISTMSGKTIEVLNTDAEGRLILADALEYASELEPDEIIDFATLTGACVVGLGEYVSGLMTKNKSIEEKLTTAGKQTYEFVWQLPFMDEYKKLLESDIADIKNLGPRWGGAITAGKFLEFFVNENIPWAHVDIAGPSLKNKFTNYTQKWENGFGVRLMFEYLRKL